MKVDIYRDWGFETDINTYDSGGTITIKLPKDGYERNKWCTTYPYLSRYVSEGSDSIRCRISDVLRAIFACKLMRGNEDGYDESDLDWAKIIMVGDSENAWLFDWMPEHVMFVAEDGSDVWAKYDDVMLVDEKDYEQSVIDWMDRESENAIYDHGLSLDRFWMGRKPVSAWALFQVTAFNHRSASVVLWPNLEYRVLRSGWRG